MHFVATACWHHQPDDTLLLGVGSINAAALLLLQVSSSLADKVHDSYILKEVTGSDHVPLGLVLKKA
jgi:hypothetical protein